MKIRSFLYLLAAFLAFPSALLAGDAIRVEVSVADAAVTPRADAKQALMLPDLEYSLQVEASCASGSVPSSLSIGVADTRYQFQIDAAGNPTRFSTTFAVPSPQLAPVAKTGYCIADDPASHGTVLVREVFTAQLSLSCRSDGSSSMHYLSQPLSVRLVCAAPTENQDSSPDSAR